ncbi:MAG: hypothetical protein H6579_03910 [Chitinophagales bacterium]|nr:hypothetical protein [Bacteroidota bacterium]MCB9256255.1 hypothetical protein [Chitinophagales bacterium]
MEQARMNEVVVKSEDVPSDFQFSDLDKIPKEDLLYHIEKVELKNKSLSIVVQYGGGCVKPHHFELHTDGRISEEGNMNFFLLHKTRNDMCKALIIEELNFDLSLLYQLESKLLKGIVLNKDFKLSL